MATKISDAYTANPRTTWTGVEQIPINDGTANPAAGLASDLKTYVSGDKLPKAGGTMSGALNEAPTVTIASSTTPAIGAAAGNSILLTGTTTVTGFDTIAAGAVRRVRFGGILTLTHNSTSLILPTAASITTAADDVATFLSLGSGNWFCTSYSRKSGAALAGSSTVTTTKGDLAGYSTLSARVPVGANGTALVADSTQALGLGWKDLAAPYRMTTQSASPRKYLDRQGTFRDPLQIGLGVITAGTIATITDDTKYNAWPVICRLRSNKLLLAYTKGDTHHGDTTGKAVGKFGTENLDGTLTWTSEFTIYQDTTPRWTSIYGVSQLSTGRIIATLWRDLGSGTTGTAGYVYSDDAGTTWSAWQDLGTPSGYSESYCTGPAVELPNGDVLITLETDNTGSSFANRNSILVRSTDGGTTFGSPTTIRLYVTDTRPYYESKLILLADDSLLIVHRCAASTPGDHYTQKSTDGGATWTAPVLAFAGLGAPSTILLSTGTLICATRRNATYSQIVYTSTDNAATWSALTVLDATMNEQEYGAPIELRDGRILVVYGYQPSAATTNCDIKGIICTESKTAAGVLDLAAAGGTLPISKGGTGTTTPALVSGTNVTITGSWPNQTINSTASGAATTTDRSTLRVIGRGDTAASFIDYSTNARTLTTSGSAVNATTPVPAAPVGPPWSISLPSTGSRISVPDSSAWNTTSPTTWEALFYVDLATYSGASAYYTLLGQSSVGTGTKALFIFTSSTTAAGLYWNDKDGTGVSAASINSGNTIAPRTYHHAAMVSNGIGTTTRLFLDGVLVASTNMGSTTADLTSALLIGAWSDGAAYFATRDFIGNLKTRISSYARYNRAPFLPPTDFAGTDAADAATSAWNPSDKNAAVTLSGSNRIASTTTSTGAVRGTTGVNAASAHSYFEVTVGGPDGVYLVGIGNATAALTSYPGNDINGWGYYGAGPTKYNNAVNTAYGVTWTAGDVIGVEINAGVLTFWKNGYSQGTAYSGLTGTVYPMVAAGINTGGPRTALINTGQVAFDYGPPSGAVAWG